MLNNKNILISILILLMLFFSQNCDKLSPNSIDNLKFSCVIYFVSNRDKGNSIYSANIIINNNKIEIKNETQLMDFNNNTLSYLLISPNGMQLVFSVFSYGIYTLNTSGGNSVKIINSSDYGPPNSTSIEPIQFAKDSQRLLYVPQPNGVGEIWIINSNGSNKISLAKESGSHFFDSHFLPDETKIVYRGGKYGLGFFQSRIGSMDANGANKKLLTDSTKYFGDPCISPNGLNIACILFENNKRIIYSMNIDGSNLIRLTDMTQNNQNPIYSPDGTKIYFHSDRDGNYNIYRMDNNGSNQKQLTFGSGTKELRSFSKNGDYILYISGQDGNLEIYIMDNNGNNHFRITNNSLTDSYPVFDPNF